MTPEPVRLDLQESAVEELIELARAGDTLPRIIALAAEAGPHVGVKSLSRQVSKKIGTPSADLWPLFFTILNLYHTQTNQKVDSAAIVEAVTRFFRRKAAASGSDEKLKAWAAGTAKVLEALSQLSSDHALEAAYKANRVASSRQIDLVGMRIFTEARPVFNEAGDRIIQTIVSHTLSFDYHEGNDHKVIQFNLDANDVVDLRKICERAERKAVVIKRDLKPMDWPTTIFRESTDLDTRSQ